MAMLHQKKKCPVIYSHSRLYSSAPLLTDMITTGRFPVHCQLFSSLTSLNSLNQFSCHLRDLNCSHIIQYVPNQLFKTQNIFY